MRTRSGLGAPVASVVALTRGVSPRVMLARVTLDNGTNVTLSGTTIQADLGLPSTWFSVVRTSTGGSSSDAAVSQGQIAAFVVTHYAYANWRHAAASWASAATRNPASVANIIAWSANTHVSASNVAAFAAAHCGLFADEQGFGGSDRGAVGVGGLGVPCAHRTVAIAPGARARGLYGQEDRRAVVGGTCLSGGPRARRAVRVGSTDGYLSCGSVRTYQATWAGGVGT